jgi:hypothetical protein
LQAIEKKRMLFKKAIVSSAGFNSNYFRQYLTTAFCALFFLSENARGNQTVALPDSTKPPKQASFFSMAFSYPDRAASFEENLFKDAQLVLNASVIQSNYNFSNYILDEQLLNENSMGLSKNSSLTDPSRKFSKTRMSIDLSGRFLFFYAGLGIVVPSTSQTIILGEGNAYYTANTQKYYAEIRKSSFLKVGIHMHFRRFCLFGGLRSYQGIGKSSLLAVEDKSGKRTKIVGIGSNVFNGFFEAGLSYQNFTIGFEKALNIDYPGAECTSISIGYNLFDLRNYNEKRIPR